MQVTREMLEEVLEQTSKFPENNFGLKVGEGWPAFVTEALKSEKVQNDIGMHFLLAQLMASTTIKPLVDKAIADRDGGEKINPLTVIAKESLVYEQPLRYMFMGILLGRRIAEVERLQVMATETA